jgi:DNA-binding beta-propeller fold protein YncE
VGVVADAAGNVWVSNAATNTVTEVTPTAAAAGYCSNSSCIVYSGPFSSPGALLVDHGGNVWVLGQESVDEIPQAAIASGSCSNSGCPQVLGPAK